MWRRDLLVLWTLTFDVDMCWRNLSTTPCDCRRHCLWHAWGRHFVWTGLLLHIFVMYFIFHWNSPSLDKTCSYRKTLNNLIQLYCLILLTTWLNLWVLTIWIQRPQTTHLCTMFVLCVTPSIPFSVHLQDGGRRADDFLNMMEPVASSLPYMTCPGNHEYYA